MAERFLVVKLADVGDLLTATPALRALRQRFPDARVDVLAPPHSAEVLRGLSSVDDLIPFRKALYDSPRQAARPGAVGEALRLARRLRAGRYDAVLILHHLATRWGSVKYAALALATGAPRRLGLDNGLGRAWFLTDRAPDGGFGAAHEVDYALRVVDLLGPGRRTDGPDEGPPAALEVSVSADDVAVAERLVVPDDRPTIAIHPGSGGFSLARRWPPASFAAVANELADRMGARVALVGGPDEVGLCAEVAARLARPPLVLAGQTTLKQLAAALRKCDLLIANDGGVMHLAVAVGTPVVAVFGLSNHRAWGPYGFEEWPLPPGRRPAGRSLVVRVDLPCSPCLYRGHSLGNRHGCAARDCLQLVTPAMVASAAVSLMSSASPTRQGIPPETRRA